MSNSDQLRERLQQNRAALSTDAAAARGNTDGADRRTGCTFLVGDRVFDLVNGADGTVERSVSAQGAAVEHVEVRLTGGRLVSRRADQLVARPTPPSEAR